MIEEAPRPRGTVAAKEYGLSPFEDFNQRGDAVGLLQKHGWSIVRETNERVILRRPGKTEGTSGDYLKDKRWFSVFTTSTQFEPQKAYNPSAVFCLLECGGDWKRAGQVTAERFNSGTIDQSTAKRELQNIEKLKESIRYREQLQRQLETEKTKSSKSLS